MSEYTPITGELRDTLERGKCIFTNSAGFEQVNVVKDALDSMLDAIDAVHAGLERENAKLRERVDTLEWLLKLTLKCAEEDLRGAARAGAMERAATWWSGN